MWKKFIVILSVVVIGVSSSFVYASVGVDSYVSDFLIPVMHKRISDGSDFLTTKKGKSDRIKLNQDVKDGNCPNTCLYDRFGPNLYFSTYIGERSVDTGFSDKVYTAGKGVVISSGGVTKVKDSDIKNFKVPIGDIKEIIQSDNHFLNTSIYQNRPGVINDKIIDKRYDIYKDDVRPQIFWENLFSLNKVIFTLQSEVICSKEIRTDISDLLSEIFPDAGEDWSITRFLKDLTKTFLPVFVLFMCITISSMYIRKKSFKQMGIKALSYVVFSCLFFTFVLNPSLTINFYKMLDEKVVTPLEESMTLEDLSLGKDDFRKPVIGDSDSQMKACLWYISIFDPWVRGMFDGKKYNELYLPGGKTKENCKYFEISDDDIDSLQDGEKGYSCAYTIGDIKIPTGGNSYENNLGALAYSLGSKYHINATNDTYMNGKTLKTSPTKPSLCPNSSSIYIDDLRLIDARMNVSPAYKKVNGATIQMNSFADEDDNDKYSMRLLNQNIGPYVMLSIYKNILIFPIAIFSIGMIYMFIKLSLSFLRVLGAFIKNMLIKSDPISETTFLKKIGSDISMFMSFLILKLMLLFLYFRLCESEVGSILYMFIAAFMITNIFDPQKYDKLKYKIKRYRSPI